MGRSFLWLAVAVAADDAFVAIAIPCDKIRQVADALGPVVATKRVCVSRYGHATSAAVKTSSARSGSARWMHHSSHRAGGGELFLAAPRQSGMAAGEEINVQFR